MDGEIVKKKWDIDKITTDEMVDIQFQHEIMGRSITDVLSEWGVKKSNAIKEYRLLKTLRRQDMEVALKKAEEAELKVIEHRTYQLANDMMNRYEKIMQIGDYLIDSAENMQSETPREELRRRKELIRAMTEQRRNLAVMNNPVELASKISKRGNIVEQENKQIIAENLNAIIM